MINKHLLCGYYAILGYVFILIIMCFSGIMCLCYYKYRIKKQNQVHENYVNILKFGD